MSSSLTVGFSRTRGSAATSSRTSGPPVAMRYWHRLSSTGWWRCGPVRGLVPERALPVGPGVIDNRDEGQGGLRDHGGQAGKFVERDLGLAAEEPGGPHGCHPSRIGDLRRYLERRGKERGHASGLLDVH